jgi:hypothetical protein
MFQIKMLRDRIDDQRIVHMESLVACDFFTKPVYTLRGKFDVYVLVFLHRHQS